MYTMLANRFRARFASLTASAGTGGAPPWWVQWDPPEPSRRRVKKVNLALHVAQAPTLLSTRRGRCSRRLGHCVFPRRSIRKEFASRALMNVFAQMVMTD